MKDNKYLKALKAIKFNGERMVDFGDYLEEDRRMLNTEKYWQETEEVIEELVSKEIPMKPLERHYEETGELAYIKLCCPKGCHVQVSSWNKRCPDCGQRLDWGEED